MLAAQRSDGCWNADLVDAQDYPGPGTPGTAFLTLGLACGIRTGLLHRATSTSTADFGVGGFLLAGSELLTTAS